jgi:hypothetical protein
VLAIGCYRLLYVVGANAETVKATCKAHAVLSDSVLNYFVSTSSAGVCVVVLLLGTRVAVIKYAAGHHHSSGPELDLTLANLSVCVSLACLQDLVYSMRQGIANGTSTTCCTELCAELGTFLMQHC